MNILLHNYVFSFPLHTHPPHHRECLPDLSDRVLYLATIPDE